MKKTKLRPKDAATYLGVSVRTLHDYTTRGLIPFFKLSTRCNVFDVTDLDTFLESRKVKGGKI